MIKATTQGAEGNINMFKRNQGVAERGVIRFVSVTAHFLG